MEIRCAIPCPVQRIQRHAIHVYWPVGLHSVESQLGVYLEVCYTVIIPCLTTKIAKPTYYIVCEKKRSRKELLYQDTEPVLCLSLALSVSVKSRDDDLTVEICWESSTAGLHSLVLEYSFRRYSCSFKCFCVYMIMWKPLHSNHSWLV